jgi:hypothetical protein
MKSKIAVESTSKSPLLILSTSFTNVSTKRMIGAILAYLDAENVSNDADRGKLLRSRRVVAGPVLEMSKISGADCDCFAK